MAKKSVDASRGATAMRGRALSGRATELDSVGFKCSGIAKIGNALHWKCNAQIRFATGWQRNAQRCYGVVEKCVAMEKHRFEWLWNGVEKPGPATERRRPVT